MIFRQLVDDDLGCASYLVGDEETCEAIVVDPAYEIDPYLEEASRHECEIVRVLETHTHADHVSGHGRFALEHGVPVSIHAAAEPQYPFEPLADGDEVAAGRVTLRVIHTPGHRPEHCCFSVVDRSRADEPWLVLTGDSLFVGDAARPDLAVEAREGAEALFQSLRRLVELGDGVEVFPGHVAGSLCGAGMSSKASSTIGFERRFNPVLGLRSPQEFVSETAQVAIPRPPTIERVVELNRGPFLGAPAPLERLADAGGAAVLDVRPARAFAAGHVPGAISVPVSGSSFATKAGFVLPLDKPIAIHASSRAEAKEAARRLRAAGLLELAGHLVDPPTPATLDPVDLDELEQLLATDGVEVIDVREAYERDGGYIPGSRHIPYRAVGAFADELAEAGPVVTICESGARAAVAASVLAAAGVEARPVLDGGITEWRARGNELTAFRRCGT